jgi:hypothetical protein
MRSCHLAPSIIALLGAGTIVACSSPAPVSPESVDRTTEVSSLRARAAAGSYDLSFYIRVAGSLQSVSTLTVLSNELILGAHIADQFGAPAQRGTVTFQYCSLKGLPPNDITRADEAPSANCADGSASWANLGSMPVDQSGNAYWNFGVVQIPRTVGFRCRYLAQGGTIASGSCAPADFTWTAAP